MEKRMISQWIFFWIGTWFAAQIQPGQRRGCQLFKPTRWGRRYLLRPQIIAAIWLVVTGTWLLFFHSVGNSHRYWLLYFSGIPPTRSPFAQLHAKRASKQRHGRRHQRGLRQAGRDHRILLVFGAEELGRLGWHRKKPRACGVWTCGHSNKEGSNSSAYIYIYYV